VEMYMTFALLEYRGSGRFCAVGRHLPILVYRARVQRVEAIELEGDWLALLDAVDVAAVPEASFSLEDGDALGLYTDGIVEHSNGEEMYGYDRLKEAVATHGASDPATIAGAVLEDVERFSSAREDDMTILVIDHRGQRSCSEGDAAAAA